MFRIVRTRTLAALREEAAAARADAASARVQNAALRDEAVRAATLAGRAEARVGALTEEAGRKLGWVIRATRDPVSGEGIQGAIALQMVRTIIAEAKASGDEAVIAGIRPMDAILGEDWPHAGLAATAVGPEE
jgi:hypothetical protein